MDLAAHVEAPTLAQTQKSLAGTYMTFRLSGGDFGVEIHKVREMLGLLDIAAVPGAPSAVRGVVNLRGKVIPVVDLREKLSMQSEPAVRPVIVVVEVQTARGPVTNGVIVDQVLDVRRIAAEQIEPPPNFGHHAATRYILGVCKTEKRVVLLIDLDLVLSGDC